MASPRIVVVMSCYNEAQYLDETMPALLAQDDFAAVILDNGSTDDSRFALSAYTGRSVQVLTSARNLTPGRVANLLMHVATTLWPDCQWFVGAGADDMMQPDYLAAILRAADEQPDANLIFSPWAYIDDVRPPKRFPAFNPETCHAEHQIPAWSAITRELWEDAGPQDEQMIAADWDWVVRARRLIRAHQLDRPYIRLRVREGARQTQSDEVHWPTLHRHLCGLAGKPVPAWAQA